MMGAFRVPGRMRIVVACALLLASGLACAQVYSWKDAATGASKFSNAAPSWYSPGEEVSGPRVVVTFGGRTIDDTARPFEERLLLSGKSKEYVEKLRLQKQQAVRAPQDPARESRIKADAEAATRRSADAVSASAQSDTRKGS